MLKCHHSHFQQTLVSSVAVLLLSVHSEETGCGKNSKEVFLSYDSVKISVMHIIQHLNTIYMCKLFHSQCDKDLTGMGRA
jgi:hypothetical protein